MYLFRSLPTWMVIFASLPTMSWPVYLFGRAETQTGTSFSVGRAENPDRRQSLLFGKGLEIPGFLVTCYCTPEFVAPPPLCAKILLGKEGGVTRSGGDRGVRDHPK